MAKRRDAKQPTPPAWPARPASGVFAEVLDTVGVAQLLSYDQRGLSVERGRRNVQHLVTQGMPTLGRVGPCLMFRKSAVLEWLETRQMTDPGPKTGVAT